MALAASGSSARRSAKHLQGWVISNFRQGPGHKGGFSPSTTSTPSTGLDQTRPEANNLRRCMRVQHLSGLHYPPGPGVRIVDPVKNFAQ